MEITCRPYMQYCRETSTWIKKTKTVDLGEKRVRIGGKSGRATKKMLHVIKFLTL